MMFASAFLVCLFAWSLAVPVPEDSAGDLLLAALGTSAGTAIGTATGEIAGDLLKQGVDQVLAKGIPLLSSGLTSALSHIHLGKRNIFEDLLGQLLSGGTDGQGLDLTGILGKRNILLDLAEKEALKLIEEKLLGKRDLLQDILGSILQGGGDLDLSGLLGGLGKRNAITDALKDLAPALEGAVLKALEGVLVGKRDLLQDILGNILQGGDLDLSGLLDGFQLGKRNAITDALKDLAPALEGAVLKALQGVLLG